MRRSSSPTLGADDRRAFSLGAAAALPTILGLALGSIAGVLFAAAPEDLAAKRLKAMKSVVGRISLEAEAGGRLALRGKPIYRFDDPARGFPDGTMWVVGGSGRPSVLLTLSAEKKEDGLYWLHEFTSLVNQPVAGGDPSWNWTWNPGPAKLTFEAVPGAPVPAPNEAGRLRQMKSLARRFKGYEVMNRAGQSTPGRDDLRMLAQPVCRYVDTKTGLIDGAMFLLAYGQNPELALLIEARHTGSKEPVWEFGLARITTAECRLEFDGKDVWSAPGLGSPTAEDPYCYHLERIDEPGALFDLRQAGEPGEAK